MASGGQMQQQPQGGAGKGGASQGGYQHNAGSNIFDASASNMSNSNNFLTSMLNMQAPQAQARGYDASTVNLNALKGMLNSFGGGGGGAGSFGGGNVRSVTAPGKELYDYDPANMNASLYSAAQVKDMNVNDYMNPYLDNVMEGTMKDLGLARDQALNSTGAAATQGGAFGGDRHGIMEAQNNKDYMNQVYNASSQLRSNAFQNAQQMMGQDASAMNQSRATNAGAMNQANAANMAANNDRSQFVGGLASQNSMAAQQANQQADVSRANANTAAGASLAANNNNNATNMALAKMGYLNDAMIGNVNNLNTAAQYNSGALNNMGQFNVGNIMNMLGMQQGAANNLFSNGMQGLNAGNAANAQMQQAGSIIDAINNGYLQSGMDMWNGQTQQPWNNFQYWGNALSGANMGQQTQTGSSNPGLFGWASMLLGG